MHRALFSGDRVDLALPGADADSAPPSRRDSRALALLRSTIRCSSNSAAAGSRTRLVEAAPTARRHRDLRPARAARRLALLVAAAWRAPTRRRGARRAALGLALTGGALVAVTTSARAVVLSSFDTSHGDAVVGTIWDTFLGDLRSGACSWARPG